MVRKREESHFSSFFKKNQTVAFKDTFQGSSLRHNYISDGTLGKADIFPSLGEAAWNLQLI